MTESELKSKVATLLGGRAAEELIYDEVRQGDDHHSKATDIARSMVKTFGMSARVGQASFEKDRRSLMLQAPGEPQLRGDYSEQTARSIDDEVRRIVDEQHERATEILSQRHEVLLRAAQVRRPRRPSPGTSSASCSRPASRRSPRQTKGRRCPTFTPSSWSPRPEPRRSLAPGSLSAKATAAAIARCRRRFSVG